MNVTDLVGGRVFAARLATRTEHEAVFGPGTESFSTPTLVVSVELQDGRLVDLVPSRDYEGNGAGALFGLLANPRTSYGAPTLVTLVPPRREAPTTPPATPRGKPRRRG